MTMKYYAVKWYDQVRISTKQASIRKACIYCFGICSNNMWIKDLGTTKTGVHKRITKLHTEEDGAWQLIPSTELNSLELGSRE